MADPLYTVTVANLTRGWTYSHTHDPDQADVDPAAPVQLADDLTYLWGFPNDLVPSPILEPNQAKVRLWCRDAPSVPPALVGDLVTIDVRLGVDGPRIAQPPPMSIATVEAELELPETDTPAREYTALLTISCVDGLLAGLPSLFPQPRNIQDGRVVEQPYWRPRLAEIAAQIGRSLGVPTWWPDLASPTFDTVIGESDDSFHWESDAATMLTKLINTHQPGGMTHTLAPSYSVGYPGSVPALPGGTSAYRWVGPDSPSKPIGGGATAPTWAPPPAIPDPGTTLKYLLMPASRGFTGHAQLELAADWCDLPVKARRAREHIVGAVVIGGTERLVNAGGDFVAGTVFSFRGGTRMFGDPGAGITRQVNIYNLLGDALASSYPAGVSPLPPNPDLAVIAGLHISDPSTHAAWVYDEFTLLGSQVPADSRAAVLPFICPRYPGEANGDGHVLRRFTIAGIDAAAQLPDAGPVAGFMSSGQLRVVDGDLRFNLSLTPGDTL